MLPGVKFAQATENLSINKAVLALFKDIYSLKPVAFWERR